MFKRFLSFLRQILDDLLHLIFPNLKHPLTPLDIFTLLVAILLVIIALNLLSPKCCGCTAESFVSRTEQVGRAASPCPFYIKIHIHLHTHPQRSNFHFHFLKFRF